MKKFALLLTLAGLLMAENSQYFQIKKVKANDVLNIREKADYKSKKVGEIKPTETCIISHGCGKSIDFEAMKHMEEVEIQLFLSQAKNNWCYVEHKNITGWVNNFYLEESKSTCR